jgi:hypothetical protein
MAVGIRTEGLRKVYTSPPPVGGARAPGGSKKAKTTYEVVALDGLTLEVRPGGIFGLLGPLWRAAHVARRNFIQLAFQTLMQPMMFVFVFGRVMTTSGFMPPEYKSLLLPGIIAIPMELEWLAVEKVVAGMIQALIAGLVVIPTAWLVMGNVALSGDHVGLFILLALLVAMLAASFGLALGCPVGQQQIGLMRSRNFRCSSASSSSTPWSMRAKGSAARSCRNSPIWQPPRFWPAWGSSTRCSWLSACGNSGTRR